MAVAAANSVRKVFHRCVLDSGGARPGVYHTIENRIFFIGRLQDSSG